MNDHGKWITWSSWAFADVFASHMQVASVCMEGSLMTADKGARLFTQETLASVIFSLFFHHSPKQL